MSAWVVEKEHIDVMVRYATVNGLLGGRTSTEAGQMLIEENVASVCARYTDDTADTYASDLDYTYRDPGYTLTPGELFKTVGCYEYQSCEHDGWADSDAAKLCRDISEDAIGKLYDGPWGWDKDSLAAAKQVGMVA